MKGPVRVQTVRYGGDNAALERCVAAVAAAAQLATAQLATAGLATAGLAGAGTATGSITFALGDCGSPDGPGATLPSATVDRMSAMLDKAGVGFDYLPFGQNLGHGAGQNRLAGLPDPGGLPTQGSPEPAEALVLLNPDTYLVPHALVSLLRALGDSRVGIAEARQIPLEHPKPFDLATGETPWASGCAMAIPFGLFASLGGFDPAFFLHGDDVDLSWRVRMRGKVIRHVVDAAVFHDKRPSPHGAPAPTEEEEVQGMLARLLLAHRSERPDIVEEWLEWVDADGSDYHRRGAAVFRTRRSDGQLPVPYRELLGVDADMVSSVVAFVGSEYAQHRF